MYNQSQHTVPFPSHLIMQIQMHRSHGVEGTLRNMEDKGRIWGSILASIKELFWLSSGNVILNQIKPQSKTQ
jgi:hypothetical protein